MDVAPDFFDVVILDPFRGFPRSQKARNRGKRAFLFLANKNPRKKSRIGFRGFFANTLIEVLGRFLSQRSQVSFFRIKRKVSVLFGCSLSIFAKPTSAPYRGRTKEQSDRDRWPLN